MPGGTAAEPPETRANWAWNQSSHVVRVSARFRFACSEPCNFQTFELSNSMTLWMNFRSVQADVIPLFFNLCFELFKVNLKHTKAKMMVPGYPLAWPECSLELQDSLGSERTALDAFLGRERCSFRTLSAPDGEPWVVPSRNAGHMTPQGIFFLLAPSLALSVSPFRTWSFQDYCFTLTSGF